MLLEGSPEKIYQSCMFRLAECGTEASYFLVLRDLINILKAWWGFILGEEQKQVYCFHTEIKSRLNLEVFATIYVILAFTKNVRIRSLILQWLVSVLASSCHQALSKNKDTEYFTIAVSKMEIFSLHQDTLHFNVKRRSPGSQSWI
jgi:hypothetical protein